MKGYIHSEKGNTDISVEVIEKYAGIEAASCFGVVGMAMVSMKDGLVKLLRRESMTKGVDIRIEDDDRITIDFHLITVYGISISTIADNLMHTVKYQIEEYTGMKVEKINIFVEGVRVID